MEETSNKIQSLGSAIMVGESLIRQVQADRELYEKASEEKLESILDLRVKSLHKIAFNKNVTSYVEMEKEIGEEIVKFKEELQNETETTEKRGETPDSKTK